MTMPERYPDGEVWESKIAKYLSTRFPVTRRMVTTTIVKDKRVTEITKLRYEGGRPVEVQR